MKKVRKSVDRMLKEIRADDVIASILLFLPDRFKADTEVIHTTVNKLRKKYRKLLGFFEISETHPYPSSPILEGVFTRLLTTQVLSVLGPAYRVYEISSDSKKSIKKCIFTKFSKSQQKQIEEIGKALAKKLKLPKSKWDIIIF